jgi:hypothetical protein
MSDLFNAMYHKESFPAENEVHKKNHPGWIYGKNSIVKIGEKQYYKQDEISFNTNKILKSHYIEITKDNNKLYNMYSLAA